jgi:hypothetical protein
MRASRKRVPVIKTQFTYPPIPSRAYDWSAWVDGQEEHGPYGHGATEADAINDLRDQLEEK